MGQYYYPVLSKDGKTNFTAFRDKRPGGLKLMEHSWWDVELPNAVAQKMYGDPAHLWWMGDYAVDDDTPDTDPVLMAAYKAAHGNEREPEIASTYDEFNLDGLVLCNHTRRIFMDCDKYHEALKDKDEDGWVIHPLPLLTAVGNGKGGGDYFADNDRESVGTWAGDLISVENEAPKGYTEVEYRFYE